jgi:cytidylate kinase
MTNPTDIPGVRNITVSGRIGSGATTLAHGIAAHFGWDILDGGKILRKVQADLGAGVEQTSKRPDHFDLEYEEKIKQMLTNESHHVVQSHLAGFDAQGMEGIFKIFVVCEDREGNDKIDVRIDRLVNRDGISIDQAKHEVTERDRQNLEKWQRLYANNDTSWVYWDKKYYDFVINTYSNSHEESLHLALEAIKKSSV